MSIKLRLTIREACEARGITTAYGLQKAMDTFPATAARLFKGEMRLISLDALEDVMRAIGCDLADLIRAESVEDEATTTTPARASKTKPATTRARKGADLRKKALERWAISTGINTASC